MYTLQATVANVQAGGSFHAEFDGTNLAGVNLTGPISVPETAGWFSFATVTSATFSLPAGENIMRVVLDHAAVNTAVGNFDSFTLVPVKSGGGTTGGSTTPLVWKTEANAPIGVFEAHGIAADGRLYVFGGFNQDTPFFSSTNASQAYNPVTNTWATVAPMPVAESHTAVATDGTYIYVAGGYIYNPKTTWQTFGTTDVLRYDIATNTWSSITPLPSPRGGGELDYLDGELHYFGGNDGVNSTATKIAETTHWTLNLNSPNAQWVTAVPLPAPRNHLASVVLDGKIYAMGGRPTGADMVNPTTTVYVWDPTNPDVWTQAAPLLQPRAVSTAAVYNNEIYLIGGTTTNYQIISTVDVYDPTTNKWTTQTSIPAGRFAPVAGVIGNQLIVTTGFQFNYGFATTTWAATL
jgi:N-acetylneuraminic acid mutarotase